MFVSEIFTRKYFRQRTWPAQKELRKRQGEENDLKSFQGKPAYRNPRITSIGNQTTVQKIVKKVSEAAQNKARQTVANFAEH